MTRHLTKLALTGFLGVFLMAGDAEACHRNRCGGGCGGGGYSCGHRVKKCGGCHRRNCGGCGGTVVVCNYGGYAHGGYGHGYGGYGYGGYGAPMTTGQYYGTPQATGQTYAAPQATGQYRGTPQVPSKR